MSYEEYQDVLYYWDTSTPPLHGVFPWYDDVGGRLYLAGPNLDFRGLPLGWDGFPAGPWWGISSFSLAGSRTHGLTTCEGTWVYEGAEFLCGTVYDGGSNVFAFGPGAHLSGADLTGWRLDSWEYDGILREIDVVEDVSLAGADLTFADVTGFALGVSLNSVDLTGADLTGLIGADAEWLDSRLLYVDTLCPDGTNSDDNGNTCAGHLTP